MPSTIQKLHEKGIAHPPSFLPNNMAYEVISGSIAYGVATDSSDYDVYGFCFPPKEDIFPHLRGEIVGFGTQKERWKGYQEHHMMDPSARGGKGREYDYQIFSIVKYFQLIMENNANMIDSLFVPENCILHITKVGVMIREKRRMLLHKGAWHKFKGYAFGQIHRMESKDHKLLPDLIKFEDDHGIPRATTYKQACAGEEVPEGVREQYKLLYERMISHGKRSQTVKIYGFDVKFAYNVVRLLNEAEQIMTEGDLDLQRNREQLKSIRRGEWTEEQIIDYFKSKERELESVYSSSSLPHSPDEVFVKGLLLNCLEEHYGNLSDAVAIEGREGNCIREIQATLEKYQY